MTEKQKAKLEAERERIKGMRAFEKELVKEHMMKTPGFWQESDC